MLFTKLHGTTTKSFALQHVIWWVSLMPCITVAPHNNHVRNSIIILVDEKLPSSSAYSLMSKLVVEKENETQIEIDTFKYT